MLYQELPAIDAAPLDRWSRWLVPVLIAAAGLTAALLLFLAGQSVIAGMVALAGMVAAVVAAARGSRAGCGEFDRGRTGFFASSVRRSGFAASRPR